MVLQRKAAKTKVYVGGQELGDELHPLTIDLSTGGSRFDTAILEQMETGRTSLDFGGEKLIEFPLAGQPCEIHVELHGEPGKFQVAHWGQLLGQTISIDRTGIKRAYISRLEPFHFGGPLLGYPAQSTPLSDDFTGQVEEGAEEENVLLVPEDLVFNPEWEGRCVGNRGIANSVEETRFVPPEQILFAKIDGAVSNAARALLAAKTASGIQVGLWSLTQAVEVVCFLCNRFETWIANPDRAALDSTLDLTIASLRNHRVRLGAYLPEALDTLLRPFGYDWCVEFISPGVRQIRVFARGRGTTSQLKLQPAGDRLDMDASNTEAIDLSVDLSSRCLNEFRVLGDQLQIEGTFELVPAWDPETDDADIEDLMPTSTRWLTHVDSNTSRTWRDWVLNEAGDYNGQRASIQNTFDLAPYLYPCLARRRKFEPCITLGDDRSPIGNVGGITVEYLVPEQDEVTGEWSGGEWKDIAELSSEGHSIKILSHECGIRFDGPVPPLELQEAGIRPLTELPRARVRVTASIRADLRVGEILTNPSPCPAFKTETLDVGSRYKYRAIHASSIYASHVNGFLRESSAVDDRPAANALALQLLQNWNQASISGTVTLTGCGYRGAQVLGRPISGVTGRDVDFRTTAGTSQFDARYPIIVGLRYDFGAQTLVATLDTFRGEVMG